MGKRWNYCGDINLKDGGYFWREDGADDYVCVARVTPCSDAGGPSNLFWIESGSIYLPNDLEKRKQALAYCGYNDPAIVGEKPLTRFQKRAQLVEAFMAYHGIECDPYGQRTVQIGKAREPARECESVEPDTVLRANADLRNYVRKEFLR